MTVNGFKEEVDKYKFATQLAAFIQEVLPSV
jgi:hypothetical protein